MRLNLLLCYSAVRWKSVISRRVKIYKSTVGKREKKTWETEGEKVRGRSGREEEGGKSTPSTDHVKVNLGRVRFTSHSGRWTTADSRHRFNHSDVKLGICCTHASQSAVSFSFFSPGLQLDLLSAFHFLPQPPLRGVCQPSPAADY